MARRPRVHFPGALYYVISRGNQRQKIYKAKYLGRDSSTMSLALKRLEEEIATDSSRQMQMERLCTRLRPGRRRNYQISKA
jgi:hypothetical protein